jgi:KaiC/GvpD/RAD55 family RecA-like ATPase
VKSTIKTIEELTFKEPLPSGMIMITGVTGSGATTFCQQYSYETLVGGGKVLWITTEELPSSLRSNMKSFGWNVDRYEAEDRLQILDAVSPARLGFTQNVGHGMLELDPTGMLIVITDRLRNIQPADHGKFLLVINSISRLLLSCDPRAVIDFVSCLNSRMENFRLRGFATLVEDAHESKLISSLIFSSSGAIKFRIREEGGIRSRQFRVESLRGGRHDDNWKSYVITGSGIGIEA